MIRRTSIIGDLVAGTKCDNPCVTIRSTETRDISERTETKGVLSRTYRYKLAQKATDRIMELARYSPEKYVEILSTIFNRRDIKALLQPAEDPNTDEAEVNAAIANRIKSQVTRLKTKRETHFLAAYQTLLMALGRPTPEDGGVGVSAIAQRVGLKSTRGLRNNVNLLQNENEDDDGDYFPGCKRRYRNATSEEVVKQIVDFWHANTRPTANRSCVVRLNLGPGQWTKYYPVHWLECSVSVMHERFLQEGNLYSPRCVTIRSSFPLDKPVVALLELRLGTVTRVLHKTVTFANSNSVDAAMKLKGISINNEWGVFTRTPNVSLTVFKRYRPFYVKKVTQKTCMCVKCTNPASFFSALQRESCRASGNKFMRRLYELCRNEAHPFGPSLKTLDSLLTCDKTNLRCSKALCKKCGWEKLLPRIQRVKLKERKQTRKRRVGEMQNEERGEVIKWQQYTYVNKGRVANRQGHIKTKRSLERVWKEGSFSEFLDGMIDSFRSFSLHLFRDLTQKQAREVRSQQNYCMYHNLTLIL